MAPTVNGRIRPRDGELSRIRFIQSWIATDAEISRNNPRAMGSTIHPNLIKRVMIMTRNMRLCGREKPGFELSSIDVIITFRY